MSGKRLLVSLCNLARQIDDWDNKIPFAQLIIQWCKENMHPYSIDFVYQELTKKGFILWDMMPRWQPAMAYFQSMTLWKIWICFTPPPCFMKHWKVCVADDDAAYDLYKEGKYFEELPFFESFKCVHGRPDIDVSPVDGNLVKEIQLHAEHQKSHPAEQPSDRQFMIELYNNYGNCSIN